MKVPVDDAAACPVPLQPGGWFEIINENSQRQSFDFSLHEYNIASNMTAVKRHGNDIRRIDADLAGVNARRNHDADRIGQRVDEVEDRTSVVETGHAVLQQQVENSQDDTWQAIEDTRNDQRNIWDHVHGLGDLASQACNVLQALTRRMDGVPTLASANKNKVGNLKRRIDGAERQASDTSNQVETLKVYGHQLKKLMRRAARETRDMLARRDAILDRHESTIRGLQRDLATDRLVNELRRLSVHDDTPAAENNPPTSNALVPWNARPAVRDATSGRIDELRRTFQAYYRRLQARTERVERIGRENRTQSNHIIRECNVRLARLMMTMQVIDAIHFAVAAALNDHDTVLRRHGRRISRQSTRTNRITEVLDDHAYRLDATDTRLTVQSTRTDHIDARLHDIDTELGIQSTRTDRVHDRLVEMQSNRDDDLTRMDMTEDRVEGHDNTIHRIDGALNEILLNRDEDLTRMDTTEDRLITDVRRIDGTLNEIRWNRVADLARMDATDDRVTTSIQRANGTLNELRITHTRQQAYNLLARGTQAQLDLLEQEHTRMSQYLQSRVSDAMAGNVATGMSRVMEDMNAQIQRLSAEVAT
ncbi:MAG: hypothetical protein Q9197_003470 [Variospora fuerteventurae]